MSYYTKEQIRRADQTPLVPLLEQRGYALKRSGKEWTWTLPGRDRVTICGNKWYSHYEKVGGGAVAFLQKYFGYDFMEAMWVLVGEGQIYDGPTTVPNELQMQQAMQRKPFQLPPHSKSNNVVMKYLVDQRFVSPEIVQHFIDKGILYESEEVHQGHSYHDLILVGTDRCGHPRQAHSKGISPGSTFRYDIEGSDKNYGFHHIGTSDKLYVFEAAVDMVSYLTLHPANWQQHSYLALGGTAEYALLQALQDYPCLRQVTLCLDHDPGGQLGVIRLTNILFARGYSCTWKFPQETKDWNETLKMQSGKPYQKAEDHAILKAMLNAGLEIYQVARQENERTPLSIGAALERYDSAEDATTQRQALVQCGICAANRAIALMRHTSRGVCKEAFLAGFCAAVRINDTLPTIAEIHNTVKKSKLNEVKEMPKVEQEIRIRIQQYLLLAGKCVLLEQSLEQELEEKCQMNLC